MFGCAARCVSSIAVDKVRNVGIVAVLLFQQIFEERFRLLQDTMRVCSGITTVIQTLLSAYILTLLKPLFFIKNLVCLLMLSPLVQTLTALA